MAKQENDKKNNKHFWKDFKAEIKKVIWPTKKQLTNNTIVVVSMVIITALIVLILDLVFEALNTYGINRVKEVVQTSISETVEEEKADNETAENEEVSENNENVEENAQENVEGEQTAENAENQEAVEE